MQVAVPAETDDRRPDVFTCSGEGFVGLGLQDLVPALVVRRMEVLLLDPDGPEVLGEARFPVVGHLGAPVEHVDVAAELRVQRAHAIPVSRVPDCRGHP